MEEQVYAAKLERKLIDQFKMSFYEKMGYYPVVLTKITTGKQGFLRILPLEELDEFFVPYLPERFGRIIPIKSKLRYREIVTLRQIFCAIARQMGYSFKSIGEHLGGRDHTTAIHNINAFNNLLETEESYREKYLHILHDIKNAYPDEPPTLDDFDQVLNQPEPAVLP